MIELTFRDENSLTTQTTSFMLSGNKIIVNDIEGKWREEINIKHISHVRCDNESSNYRKIGGIIGVSGVLVLYLSYQRMFIYYKDILMWLGVILLISGLILFILKFNRSIITITLTGVNQPLKYQLENVTSKRIQEFISKILPSEEKKSQSPLVHTL